MESGDLVVVNKASIKDAKVKELKENIKAFGNKKILIIDGLKLDKNFSQAARNLSGVDILPSIGANVYDILRKDTVIITRAGIDALKNRLRCD